MDSDILSFLDGTENHQFRLLKNLILQPSHTLDKEGVDLVGKLISEALADCDLTLTIDEKKSVGNNLIFSSAACTKESPHILLVGHMDTVFPRESKFNFYREDEDKAYGPGIIDMKGGLVTAVFMLKALQRVNLLNKIPIVFICNSDEEKGSLQSADLIRRYAADTKYGLVFECGGLDGEVVTGRKGKAGYRLDVTGKSGHAAFSAKNGKASAVTELAHKILALENLNNPAREMVVNVGRIEGGTGANVVPGKATAEIDTRYISEEDGLFLRRSIVNISENCHIPGTQAELSLVNSRFPMEQSDRNRALFTMLQKRAVQLGVAIKSELRSGVSDANTIAEKGIAVLDGLGPVGDLDHSEDEFMLKDSLLERCKLASLLVLDIWQKDLASS